jgi:hypothetical protein
MALMSQTQTYNKKTETNRKEQADHSHTCFVAARKSPLSLGRTASTSMALMSQTRSKENTKQIIKESMQVIHIPVSWRQENLLCQWVALQPHRWH